MQQEITNFRPFPKINADTTEVLIRIDTFEDFSSNEIDDLIKLKQVFKGRIILSGCTEHRLEILSLLNLRELFETEELVSNLL
jgi:hypothetical protein